MKSYCYFVEHLKSGLMMCVCSFMMMSDSESFILQISKLHSASQRNCFHLHTVQWWQKNSWIFTLWVEKENVSSIFLPFFQIDSFEYLHSKGYVHKDFKGANVLLTSSHDPRNGAFGEVFLVDYGLVSKFNYLGMHKPFEPDARTAHEGTLEYTSRDFHLGCKFIYNIILS